MWRAILSLLLFGAFGCVTASATKIKPTPLQELMAAADLVVVGRVDKVTMHKASGTSVTDPSARTGPGMDNELRLEVQLDRTKILKGTLPPNISQVVVPLWRMWHMDLAGARDLYEGHTVVLLLDSKLEPSAPAEFIRDVADLGEIKASLGPTRPESQPLLVVAEQNREMPHVVIHADGTVLWSTPGERILPTYRTKKVADPAGFVARLLGFPPAAMSSTYRLSTATDDKET